MIITEQIGKYTKCSTFGAGSKNSELFLTIVPPASDLESSLNAVMQEYESVLKTKQLSEKTLVFSRLYLSDLANQKKQVLQSRLMKFAAKGGWSVIEQCPLHGGKIALFSYHIQNPKLKRQLFSLDDQGWRNLAKITGNNYSLVVTSNFSEAYPFDSEIQTREMFSSFISTLKNHGCKLLDNCLRTWIYVRDIDNHYQGMVKARKETFFKEGLTPETRYIASTGIEGKAKETSTLVSMDAFSLTGLKADQLKRVEAREYLNPTHEYGVTFERGSRVDFGDRSHIYISGTASIDKYGHTIHLEDVRKQTERTLENIEALLKSQNCRLDDMAYLIVYLRNITDKVAIEEVLNARKIHNKPIIMVQGSVCRPEWLVEMEGVAAISNSSSWPDFI